jgi:hypothetical protein
MARIVVAALALGAAVIVAVIFGAVAHDGLGIGRGTIRTAALCGIALIGSAWAARSMLKRNG